MKVALQVVKGPETGSTIRFTERNSVIGRDGKDRPVHFKPSQGDPYVSHRHFILDIAPPRVSLKDLDSADKPTVNRITVRRAPSTGAHTIAGYHDNTPRLWGLAAFGRASTTSGRHIVRVNTTGGG